MSKKRKITQPKTPKTTQPSTRVAAKPKLPSFQRFDFGSWRDQPISQGYLEERALEIIEWAEKDENALKLTQFYIKHRWYEADVSEWRKRCDNFDKALLYAKMVIGTRRELGGLRGDLSEGMVTRAMPIYDKEHKELEEWRASLKQPIILTKQVEVIEIPAVTSDIKHKGQ
jgi:hypothetical protein